MRRLLALTAVALALPVATAEAVVGGRPATEPYPHMTALYRDGSFICGAQLVAADLVLTAAHCVVDEDGRPVRASRFRLDTGATNAPRRAPATAVTPVELRVHPDYDGGYRNDVALLRLAAPAPRGGPIALADPVGDRASWEPGDDVRLLGFGSRVPDQGTVTAGGPLHEVDIPVLPDDRCESAYGGDYDPAIMLCAGRETGLQDACQGDSGGPLMARRPDGTRVLVGTVSFGLLCGIPGLPGVYAKVGEGPLNAWVRAALPAGTAPGGGTGGGSTGGGGAPPTGSPEGGGERPATTRPRPAVRLRTSRLLLRRDGRVAVRLACRERRTCRGSVTLTRGGRRAGRSTYRIAAGRARTVKVRVARRYRRVRALRVRVTVAGGRSVTRVMRLRR